MKYTSLSIVFTFFAFIGFFSCSKKSSGPTVATLTTTTITNIAATTATGGGNITSDGGATISFAGVCWSTSTGPTIALSTKTIDATGSGSFTSSITGLTAGTTYYVRAYATNSAGTAYGTELTFTTTSMSIPTITTTALSSITSSSAASGGNVSSDGGDPVTARGVCWGTATAPTVALATKTTDGAGTGTFTSSISGLSPGTTYYVRSYATNSLGTAYGSELSFTTPLSVGVSYQGGIVAYILQPGDAGYDPLVQHGLIAATTDQSASALWGCVGIISGATDTTLGAGKANTTLIVSTCGAGTAAQLCDALVLNGYSDWYLPSSRELDLLHTNRVLIGGFTTAVYWTSSEIDNTYSIGQIFPGGTRDGYTKFTGWHVRAIRAF